MLHSWQKMQAKNEGTKNIIGAIMLEAATLTHLRIAAHFNSSARK